MLVKTNKVYAYERRQIYYRQLYENIWSLSPVPFLIY